MWVSVLTTGVVAGGGVSDVGFLCDLFHLANNGDNLDQALDRYADRIAHVQIADHPGRHEPGTGTLDLQRYLPRRIEDGGYDGYVGVGIHPNRRNSGQPRIGCPGSVDPFPSPEELGSTHGNHRVHRPRHHGCSAWPNTWYGQDTA